MHIYCLPLIYLGARFNSGSHKIKKKFPSWKAKVSTDSELETIANSTTISTSIPTSEKIVDQCSVEKNNSFTATQNNNKAKCLLRSSKSFQIPTPSNSHDPRRLKV